MVEVTTTDVHCKQEIQDNLVYKIIHNDMDADKIQELELLATNCLGVLITLK